MSARSLLLDIGNSRIKWALLEGDRLCPKEAFAYKAEQTAPLFEESWGMLSDIRHVIVSNVGGENIAGEVKSWCFDRWGIYSHFVQPARQAYGVINGYQMPQQLGVDRWVCLVGARAMDGKSLCIIDCGTAVTIDALSARGKHLGGMISPGLRLMKAALLNNTSDIAEAGDRHDGFLGQRTADAVQNGSIHSIAGLIEKTVRELEKRYGEKFNPVLTGGDAELIKDHLNCDVRLVPDLALKGLAVIVQDQAK